MLLQTREGGAVLDRRVDPEGSETRVIHSLADFRDKAVLEIGSGDGRLTWRYADHAARVLGLDPLSRDVRRARRETPERLRSVVRFVRADATTYSYPKSAFDVAVLSHSL